MDFDDAPTLSGRKPPVSNGIEHIFIVEDEVLVAMDMADMLEDFGFQIVGPAAHQEDAIAIARKELIDAAFLDVNLGQKKTSEPVAEILRERDIPFIFITAYDASQVTFRTSDERVLKKPVTGHEMLATLRELIPEYEQN